MKLWEKDGTFNPTAQWLAEVRDAIGTKFGTSSEVKWSLGVADIKKTINKKKNWTAPGPDRIVNFWWNVLHVHVLHRDLVCCFETIARNTEEYPLWFTGGKTILIPKSGSFASNNH